MMKEKFSSTIPGKWILAGEHAVLRGCEALVFPVYARTLFLEFYSGQESHDFVKAKDLASQEMIFLFSGVLDRALEMLNKTRRDVSGHFLVSSNIQIGAGMGASAALCVSVVKWLEWKGWLSQREQFEFARELENMFHGESSGVDIAVSLAAKGLVYKRGQGFETLNVTWQPQWYLSYSGGRGVTSECVKQVKSFIEKNPIQGAAVDARMAEAVQLAKLALQLDESQGLLRLVEAIELAHSCFVEWGLTHGMLETHMQYLRSNGAIAVKPTGSGLGGYVLSLWTHEPPAAVKSQLISLQNPEITPAF